MFKKNIIQESTRNFLEILTKEIEEKNKKRMIDDLSYLFGNDLFDDTDDENVSFRFNITREVKNNYKKKKDNNRFHQCPNCKRKFNNGHALGGHLKYCNPLYNIKKRKSKKKYIKNKKIKLK
jgi:hypothetical protein